MQKQPIKRILVTGATGRIGRVVIRDLLDRGYRVRATTSKTPPQHETDMLEWRQIDFLKESDFTALTSECHAVVHLAAEIGAQSLMQRMNVDTTRSLTEAAENAGVDVFVYISTVSVYGSGASKLITETSPVLTHDQDVRSQYWALDYVRTYGRSKLAGEIAVGQVATKMRCVSLRPSVVVDISQIIGIRDWGVIKKNLAAHRHAHHIYVKDVSDAIIWFMKRGFEGGGLPGELEVYNLADDDIDKPRHVDFMRAAFRVTNDKRFLVLPVPGLVDWLHDFLRFRTLPLRNPLWRMRFSTARLEAVGYKFRYGMGEAQHRALRVLQDEPRGGPPTVSSNAIGRSTVA
ncbi:NAD-dependent epimerase/dehydratase family protein [Rhizobium tumorigenes]|uniref:NAD-dependent epimerase/dehydratase family protein n=1 Tax=Rhizobium tumorigenes TaxID=2041385 RepID=UPI00241D8846|nr:NAD(P)-dependent oxidoreductase [Rhizobium tumorigenes]WFS03307.1 NAD(P)-dependent oxidoreductase [Rhizobium tumorigenes]